jgi:hypothetical protein
VVEMVLNQTAVKVNEHPNCLEGERERERER